MSQHELCEMEELSSPRLPLAVDCSSSSSYPSIYRGGTVDLLRSRVCRVTSIVCQTDYWHLSPEELRFRDLGIHLDPPRWELSCEEERLRYYLDEGLTSVPQFSPPTTAPAFSVSSRVSKPTSSVEGSSYLELGCPAPGTTIDGESATSTCSLCAARLEAEAEGDEEVEATSGGSDRDTPSRHSDTREKKKRKQKRISRRVRRLENTVESLSQGLILALTELQDRTTTADGRKSDNVDALATALSGLSTAVDHPDSTPGTSAPDATLPHPSEPAARRRESASNTKLGTAERNDGVATENDSSISISDDRSPISGLLTPILDFMACPEVHQTLKWARAHPGLRSTQLFDLLWVANNLFNVHGGIMIYCLQTSLIPMDDISAGTASSAWSRDPALMQRLDETYCKHLRPHIGTVGSFNGVAKAAWESYCFELGRVLSEKFPDWGSATPFVQKLSRAHDCLGPIITSSYIEDMGALWTPVHPALLEVTRWLEPFIDYGPDYHRATPLYDATIALGRHALELFIRKGGITEPAMISATPPNNLMHFLCKHRSGDLKAMQHEMESIMNSIADSRDVVVDADAEVAALVDRAKQATLWRVEDPQIQDALARREIRVMKSYRPKLLRAGTAAARIRSEMLDVLVTKTGPWAEAEVFWDGCERLSRRSEDAG